MKQSNQEHQRPVDIAFVHASPMFDKNKRLAILDFKAELWGIKQAIKNSNMQIKFQQILGTQKNLTEIVNKCPQILHVTCHGEYEQDKGKLMLETEQGDGVWVMQEDLFASCKQIQNVDLVFIAACNSDKIGQMLITEAGVKHVISSEEKQTLVDQTTIDFTYALY